ncbi:MAG: cytochrome b [Rhodobacteraceae bacterium]|nr:cytochrome b [Paracoccaceae bacterium]
MIRNTPTGYGAIAIAFHWTMALLIIGMFIFGKYMHSLPPTDPSTFQLYQLHKSVGFVVLGLALLRIVWRLMNPAPKLPEGMHPLEKLAAHLGHIGLYTLMLAIPLSGWLLVSASPWGIPTIVFNTFEMPHLPIPALFGSPQDASDLFQEVHEALALFIMILAGLHVAAALKHHFISKDGVLKRMTSTQPAKEHLK